MCKIFNKKTSLFIKFINMLVFILICYFCSLPVISVIFYGVNGNGKDVVLSDIINVLDLLKNSMVLGILVVFVALFFGIITTFTLHRINFKGRMLFRILILLPLINPSFVGSISFIMLFGKRGLITHDLLGLSISPFGFHGVFFLQVLGAVTMAYLIISSAIKNIDVSLEEAARNLGYGEFKVFLKVTLPLMIPEITTAGLLIFLSSMADFTTPMIIGGNFRTLATDIYIQITGLYNMKLASISGIFLLIPCFFAFFIQRYYIKKKRYNTDTTINSNIEYTKMNPFVKYIFITVTFLLMSVFIINILFIFVGAFTNNWGSDYSFTLKHVKRAFLDDFSKYLKPFINSVTLSVVTGLLSSFIGVMLAYLIQRKKIRATKMIDFMAMFPAAVPGILFGIGYLVTFKYPLFGIGKYVLKNQTPIILLGTTSIIYIVCVARNINISMKSCYALLEHIEDDIENAALNLGASKLRTYFTIVIPLLKDAFVNSYIKVFSGTMTTLGVIIFLLMPKNKVIVQVLFQSMTGGMNLGVPAVLSLTLSFMTLILMLVFNLIAYGKKKFLN